MKSSAQRHQQSRVFKQFSLQAPCLTADHGAAGDESIRRLLEAAKVTLEDIVLDVACGAGQVAIAFAEITQHATGVALRRQ
jgi:ubiquinone/menaquinone biosynthesis C-methylase UbiE